MAQGFRARSRLGSHIRVFVGQRTSPMISAPSGPPELASRQPGGASMRPLRWCPCSGSGDQRVHLIDREEANAFTIGGGYVYVFEGFTDNDVCERPSWVI